MDALGKVVTECALSEVVDTTLHYVRSFINDQVSSVVEGDIRSSIDVIISATDNCEIADTILSQSTFDCLDNNSIFTSKLILIFCPKNWDSIYKATWLVTVVQLVKMDSRKAAKIMAHAEQMVVIN